jgi:hypothetical protein
MVHPMRTPVRPVDVVDMMSIVPGVSAVPVPGVGGRGGQRDEDEGNSQSGDQRPDKLAAAVPAQNRHRQVPHDLASGANAPKQHSWRKYVPVITWRLSAA